jgi:hypothetical protein
MRSAAPDQRSKILEEFGPLIGRIDRALETSIAKQGSDAITTLSAIRDRLVGRLVYEIIELLGPLPDEDAVRTP